MRKLNGCNSQMLSRVTGNDVRTEARPTTSSFDVVKHIRVRCLRWLGQILRGNQGRLLYKAMEAQYSMRNPGNLFMDAPPHTDLQDLVNQSYDKVFWKSLEVSIPSHLRGVTIYTTQSCSTQYLFPIYLFPICVTDSSLVSLSISNLFILLN